LDGERSLEEIRQEVAGEFPTAGVRLSEAVRQVAETTSVSRRILYEAALEAQAARDS
jgi:hypothetical protein